MACPRQKRTTKVIEVTVTAVVKIATERKGKRNITRNHTNKKRNAKTKIVEGNITKGGEVIILMMDLVGHHLTIRTDTIVTRKDADLRTHEDILPKAAKDKMLHRGDIEVADRQLFKLSSTKAPPFDDWV
jgi:hypothetical protein